MGSLLMARLLVGCLLVVAGFAHAGHDWWDANASETATGMMNSTNRSKPSNFSVQTPKAGERTRGFGFYVDNTDTFNTTDKTLVEHEEDAKIAEQDFNETVWNLPELKYNSISRKKFSVYKDFVSEVRKTKLHVSKKSSLRIPALNGPFEPDQADLDPKEQMIR